MHLTLRDAVVFIEIAFGLALALAIMRLSLGDEAQPAALPEEGAAEGRHGGLPARKYHPVHVAIHWLVVFAMAQLLTRGALIMVNIPNNDPEKVGALRAHALAGTSVFVLMLVRLVLLKTTRLPKPAHGPTPFLDGVKRIAHPMLYISVFVQVLAGLIIAVQADLPRLFFLQQGALPESFWIYRLRTVHYLNSRLLMLLIALHLAGALYHTLVRRDGLLRRMSFGRRLAGPNGAAKPLHAPLLKALGGR